MFAEGRDAKPIREFREDTGEVSVPGESPKQQQQGAPLYADQVAKVRYDIVYLHRFGAHNAVPPPYACVASSTSLWQCLLLHMCASLVGAAAGRKEVGG
jgi:hypothetical protein